MAVESKIPPIVSVLLGLTEGSYALAEIMSDKGVKPSREQMSEVFAKQAAVLEHLTVVLARHFGVSQTDLLRMAEGEPDPETQETKH
jgi:hypothetical protein